ncbi:MAG: hypothetical protein PHE50_10585, partial [Dehalococcoidales bacterium]|nr:hypothetical protein [Dehalococcoidales bacterium]
KAGKAIFLTNPGAPKDIAEIGALWGFDVKSGTIIDPDSYAAPNINTPTFDRNHIYPSYVNSGISSLFFPGMTAVEIGTSIPQNMDAVPLLVTNKSAWVTDNFDPSVTQKYDATKDYAQPDTGLVGALILSPSTANSSTTGTIIGPSIAIIGDSDFATNKYFYSGDNGKFFLQIVNQFTLGVEVVNIGTKPLETRKLILTPEKSRFLNISSIALLPGIVLLLGAIVWWRRR